jgi:S1-C subfamily serine protease
MNCHKGRSIATAFAVVGLLSFLAMPTAQAQVPLRQPSPNAAAPGPAPNPEPPQSGVAAAEPGYLGVVADDRQEKGAGVRIVEIEAGGPAEQGGLKADDLITRINDTPVHSQADMRPALERLAPGGKVKFVVDRGGQQQTVEVTLGKRPPVGQRRYERFGRIPETLPQPNASTSGGGLGPATSGAEPGRISSDAVPSGAVPSGAVPSGAAPNGAPLPSPRPDASIPDASIPNTAPALPTPDIAPRPLGLGTADLPGAAVAHRPLLGVRTRPLTDETRQRLRLPVGANGALVVSRTVGSPAVQAGIPLDALITAIDGKPVGSPRDLTQLVAQAGAGREVQIAYYYGGSEQRAKVKLAEFGAGPGGLPGDGSVGASSLPAPPAPQYGRLPIPDDKTRIESLERRVQQLEHRVDDLERALHKTD